MNTDNLTEKRILPEELTERIIGCAIKVSYEGVIVGDFAADIIVNGSVVLELKTAKLIDEIHKAQLLNYLRATCLKVGLILNFGTSRLGIKRMVL